MLSGLIGRYHCFRRNIPPLPSLLKCHYYPEDQHRYVWSCWLRFSNIPQITSCGVLCSEVWYFPVGPVDFQFLVWDLRICFLCPWPSGLWDLESVKDKGIWFLWKWDTLGNPAAAYSWHIGRSTLSYWNHCILKQVFGVTELPKSPRKILTLSSFHWAYGGNFFLFCCFVERHSHGGDISWAQIHTFS